MFSSSFSLVLFAVFPIVVVFRVAYLAENDFYCSVVDFLNEKYGKFFLHLTFACSIFTWYLVETGRADLTENAFIVGVIYFLVLTATNLRVYDPFGLIFFLGGNVVIFALLIKDLFNIGGIYPVFIFSMLYSVYNLVFLNLHHIARFLNIKIDERKS